MTTRFKNSLLVLGVTLLVGAAQTAKADVLFNNFGPGDTYDFGTGWPVGRVPPRINLQDIAVAFSPTATSYNLSTITMALALFSGFATDQLTVWLTNDVGGHPGNILESFAVTNLPPFGQNNPPVVLQSALHPLLEQGQTYYVVGTGSPDILGVWNFSLADIGTVQYRNDVTIGWRELSGNPRPALRVEGDPVPEPGSVLLLGVGALGLIGYGWRRWTRVL